MKNCQEIQQELSAYVDGELASSLRAEIEAHLASCRRLPARMAGLRALAAGVAALPHCNPRRGSSPKCAAKSPEARARE